MKINAWQRRVLIIVAVAITAMMSYPPYYFARDPETSVSRGTPASHAYGWLFGGHFGRVDVELLLAQFLAVGVVGAIAFVLCSDKK